MVHVIFPKYGGGREVERHRRRGKKEQREEQSFIESYLCQDYNKDFSYINHCTSYINHPNFESVKSLSRVCLFVTPWTVAHQDPLPWDFPGNNTGVGCHFLLQGISPTQGLNPSLLCLLHCRQILYLLSHWRSQFYRLKNLRHRQV